MSRVSVKNERVVDANPDAVYAALTDYKSKRPQMLTPNFIDYAVEKGGHGSGTVVSYKLHTAGRERTYQMRTDEAVPGKVLTERDNNSSLVTTWLLSPWREGRQTKVRVITEWDGSTGVGGFFERTFAPLGLRRIYGGMLELLTYIVQPTNKRSDKQVMDTQANGDVGSNAAVFLLLFGLVMAFAFGISYFQQQQRASESD